MTKFIDANIFIERWTNSKAKEFLDKLDREQHSTSVLVLAEVAHKLKKKNIKSYFEYIRNIMGAVKVHEITQDELFNALKNPLDININDKIHIATMKSHHYETIISYDTDFDKDKTINREEL